jgi:hypothetical protein
VAQTLAHTSPANLISKKSYRGINVFLLAFAGYGSKYWLTSFKRKHSAETYAEESTAPRLFSGSVRRVRPSPQTAKLKSAGPLFSATTPYSILSKPKD